jgi:Ca-activated chloride channel family protein
VLADLELAVDGVRIEDTYPYPLPDLFAGAQLIVTGRYREGGPATVSLTGQVNGRPRTFQYDDLTFATDSLAGEKLFGGNDFIPRLWATRKIGYLLNQIRLHGENRETIDQVVNLSIRYGIITPYTSFLVEEPDLALSREGRDRIVQEEFAAAAEAPPAAVSGESAVSKAVEQNALADAEMAAPLPATTAAPGVGGAAPDSVAAVTTVGDKAFVLKNGVWTDTTFDPDLMTTTQLPFPSDLFLEFLADHPGSGKYFALGPQVIVVLDGVAYETVPGDPAELSEPVSLPEPAQPQAEAAAATPAANTVATPTAARPAATQASRPIPAGQLATPTCVAGLLPFVMVGLVIGRRRARSEF